MIESLGVLPIYDSIDKQWRNWNCITEPCQICFKATKWLVPNFIFRRPPSPYPITAFNLYKADGTLETTLTLSQIEQFQLTTSGEIWDYFAMDLQSLKTGASIIYNGLDTGETYYFEMVTAGGNYYSELFCVTDEQGTTESEELLYNFSFAMGAFGWTIINPDVTISGGSAFMLDNSESGAMFERSTGLTAEAHTLYKVCVDASNSSIVANVVISTSDGLFVFNQPGIYCFYTRNPGQISVSSSGTTWNIDSISVKKVTGIDCKTLIRFWNECDMDRIPYSTLDSFTNGIVRNFDLHRPSYPVNQTQFENGQGDKFKTYQRIDKDNFLKDGLVSEPELDALQLMKVHDNILVNVKETNDTFYKTLNVDEIDIRESYTDQSDSCDYTVELHLTNMLVQKSGCCGDFVDTICPECEPTLIPIVPFGDVICDEGFVRFVFDTTVYPDLQLGSTIVISGFTPSFLNGTWTVTFISPGSIRLDIPCAGDIEIEVAGNVYIEINACFQEVVVDFDPEGNLIITGTAFGQWVELLTGVNSGDQQCDEITFSTTNLIISNEDYQSTGFSYPFDNANNRCFKIRSFNPMIPECTFEDSFCACQEDPE